MPRTADTKQCLTWAARFGPPNEPDIGCETRELRLEKITDTDINQFQLARSSYKESVVAPLPLSCGQLVVADGESPLDAPFA